MNFVPNNIIFEYHKSQAEYNFKSMVVVLLVPSCRSLKLDLIQNNTQESNTTRAPFEKVQIKPSIVDIF
jgi:hypothetical protein